MYLLSVEVSIGLDEIKNFFSMELLTEDMETTRLVLSLHD